MTDSTFRYSACVCALLGSISLFGGGSVSLWLIQVILAGLGAWLSRSALLSNRSAGAVLTAAMAAGLNSLFPQIPLGLGCTVAISVKRGKIVLRGSDLHLEAMNKGELLICGKLQSVG